MYGLGGLERLYTKGSGRIASSRLRVILVSDKADCPPKLIRMLQDDMIRIVSRYMEIDQDKVRLYMEPGYGTTKETKQPPGILYIHIPVRSISNKGIY